MHTVIFLHKHANTLHFIYGFSGLSKKFKYQIYLLMMLFNIV